MQVDEEFHREAMVSAASRDKWTRSSVSLAAPCRTAHADVLAALARVARVPTACASASSPQADLRGPPFSHDGPIEA